MSAARQIKLLADVLDQQGKSEAPIVVIGTRKCLQSSAGGGFRQRQRGGGAVLRRPRVAHRRTLAQGRAAEHGLGGRRMSVSHCMHHALRIAKRPRASWKAEIERLPDTCNQACGAPRNCRGRIAEYLRVQWRIAERRRK